MNPRDNMLTIAIIVTVSMLISWGVYRMVTNEATETCEARWTDTQGNTHCGHMKRSLGNIRPDSLGIPVSIPEGSNLVATHTAWECQTDSNTTFFLSIIRPVLREYEVAE